MARRDDNKEQGSVELIVLGLLSALIVVLALPVISSLGQKTANSLSKLDGGNDWAYWGEQEDLNPPDNNM